MADSDDKYARFLAIKKECEPEIRRLGLSEAQAIGFIRDRVQSHYRELSDERKGKRRLYSDKVLLKVLELVDVHGVPKKIITERLNIRSQMVYSIIHGRIKPHLRKARCEALGIEEGEYPLYCKRLSERINAAKPKKDKYREGSKKKGRHVEKNNQKAKGKG